MTVVTIHKAKTELSKLLKRAEAGELIEIARRDQVVATLVPKLAKKSGQRPGYGSWKGQVTVVGDLLDPLTADEVGDWENEPIEPPH
jgi:antitoxin (DNA-binding transcriptional repressor) of toxin-antitoxin stability system